MHISYNLCYPAVSCRLKEAAKVTQNSRQSMDDWVKQMAELCQPESVHWCDGSISEYQHLMSEAVKSGSAVPLEKRPNSFLFRSDKSDVARMEDRTFISTKKKEDAGPTNNWVESGKLKDLMTGLFGGSMRGRTMFIIPFSMGPIDSPFSKLGIQITDSIYVVCSMHIMTRVGTEALRAAESRGGYVKCLHSVGYPLRPGEIDSAWPCAPIEQRYISHFPEEATIWSYGSGYGGNALLGKKSLALRIASDIGRKEGWMAEHMLLLRLVDPGGKTYNIAGAFPSAGGKTNLAMIRPTIPGWQAQCIGDDIAWMRPGQDGRLYAINPEKGFFGVAPGTSYKTNPAAMDMLKENIIFTNCALTQDGDVWWEGMGPPPGCAVDWLGEDWTPESKRPAAHPNSRFTAPASQCPIIYPGWEDPEGVPIDIIIFGGRRANTIPLVTQAYGWDHGVFLGATASSETTFASTGEVGKVRRDPFAMTPFCGYNMADYFSHWFEMGDKLGSKAPAIFYANWFRKDQNGEFLWPGFGENSRVLKWMCERVEGKAKAKATPIGYLPAEDALDLNGLTLPRENISELLRIDRNAWNQMEIPSIEAYFQLFGANLPERLKNQLAILKSELSNFP